MSGATPSDAAQLCRPIGIFGPMVLGAGQGCGLQCLGPLGYTQQCWGAMWGAM